MYCTLLYYSDIMTAGSGKLSVGGHLHGADDHPGLGHQDVRVVHLQGGGASHVATWAVPIDLVITNKQMLVFFSLV